MYRRNFLQISVQGMGMLALLPTLLTTPSYAANKIIKTDEQWRASLTPQQYNVLRGQGTELAFSSSLNNEHRNGIFVCAGCDLELFLSKYKFDSGTGWPSVYDHIDGHIETQQDYTLIIPRTEYHCARCNGHQGHVFNDGPPPTGLRHCNNGVALKFKLTEI